MITTHFWRLWPLFAKDIDDLVLNLWNCHFDYELLYFECV
jgi:hypothetical protein